MPKRGIGIGLGPHEGQSQKADERQGASRGAGRAPGVSIAHTRTSGAGPPPTKTNNSVFSPPAPPPRRWNPRSGNGLVLKRRLTMKKALLGRGHLGRIGVRGIENGGGSLWRDQ